METDDNQFNPQKDGQINDKDYFGPEIHKIVPRNTQPWFEHFHPIDFGTIQKGKTYLSLGHANWLNSTV